MTMHGSSATEISGILLPRPSGRGSSRRRSQLRTRVGAAIVTAAIGCVGFFGSASAECINYADYLHWVGGVDTEDWVFGVAVSGTHAYVVHNISQPNRSGLQVIDITDPADPTIVGSVDTPGNAQGVAVSDTLAYVADRNSGLQVISIADPRNPWIVGTEDTPGSAWGVAVRDTLAYIADGGSGLQVI